MLTKLRYSTFEALLWTRLEIFVFLSYASIITALYAVADLRFIYLPWAPIAIIGTAVAFIVGFQNNATYGRIWEARKIWGAIVNSSRVWGLQVMDLLTAEHDDGKTSEAELNEHRRVLIYRHIAWLTALRHAMRQPRSWESYNNRVSNREWSQAVHIPEREVSLEEELSGLLNSDEKERALSRTNHAAAIMSQQSRHLRELKERGLIWEFSFLEMQSTLSAFLDSQGKSERIKNFPYPRQYATLGYQCVRLFVLCVPFAALPEFAAFAATLEADWPTAGKHFIWLTVPFSALMSWLFYVMERIGMSGENPFEGSANDVPISTISRGIEIDLRQQLEEPAELIPAPLPSPRGVQM